MWVATVFHLTDLHLHLRIDGGAVNPEDREAHRELMLRLAYATDSVRWRTLFKGMSEHNPKALRAFRQQFGDLVGDEREAARRAHGAVDGAALPVVVIQTGDVEAFGARRAPDGAWLFPGWRYLQSELEPLLDESDPGGAHSWTNVFGNHDVWGGEYPLTDPRQSRRVVAEEIVRVPGLSGPWPDATPVRHALPGGRRIEIYRVSSVPEGWLSGIRARGRLTSHPLGQPLALTGGDDVLAELFENVMANTDASAIRALLLHHPVHPFGAGRFERNVATASFAERDRVANTLGDIPFHLVMAGHRHEHDPGAGETRDASLEEQPPLWATTAQLVSESPFQRPIVYDGVTPPEPYRNSFARYRLDVDETRGTLEVERTIFSYGDARRSFRALQDEPVITNLRLE